MGGFTSKSSQWFAKESKVLKRAQRAMSGTTVIRGILLAPRDKGDLQQSGRVEDNPDGSTSAVFGGNGVPYGRRRHFENKKNPQTLHYLKRAGDSVKKEGAKKYVDMSR